MKHSSATKPIFIDDIGLVLELIDNRVIMKHSSATEPILLMILTWF